MIERLIKNARCGVGDARDAEYAHLGVARGNHFRNGGHADKIRADGAQISYLSRGFVAWAWQRGVDAFVKANTIAVSFADGHFAEPSVIGHGHVRKARAETLVIGSSKRARALKIDVIFDHDQLASYEFAFDATGRVREDYSFDAHAREDADGKGDIFGGITFVQVDAALPTTSWPAWPMAVERGKCGISA